MGKVVCLYIVGRFFTMSIVALRELFLMASVTAVTVATSAKFQPSYGYMYIPNIPT